MKVTRPCSIMIAKTIHSFSTSASTSSSTSTRLSRGSLATPASRPSRVCWTMPAMFSSGLRWRPSSSLFSGASTKLRANMRQTVTICESCLHSSFSHGNQSVLHFPGGLVYWHIPERIEKKASFHDKIWIHMTSGLWGMCSSTAKATKSKEW